MRRDYRTGSLAEIQRLLRREENVVILCGAGVSMIPPTYLPSGNALRDECVRRLLADRFSARFIRQLLRSPAYQSLLPEAVLQDMSSAIGNGVDRFIAKTLKHAKSNAVHAFMSQMDNKIFTTNFDLCFEKAGARNVTHLHGHINDPQSLQYRVFRLGKTSTAERKHFQRALPASVLLVIGYSLRDSDVLEVIRDHPPKQILYISFDGSVPVSAKSLAVDFIVAKGSAEELFEVRVTTQRFEETKLRSARVPSIEKRVAALLRLCSRSSEYGMATEIMKVYRPLLRGKHKLAVMCELADILRLAGKYDEAERLAQDVLESRTAQNRQNSIWLSTAHVVVGLCDLERNKGNHNDVERHFKMGLQIFDDLVAGTRGHEFKPHDQIWRARIFNNLGLLCAQEGEYERSLSWYERSCAIKLKHHDIYGYSQTVSNMAKAYAASGRIDKAAEKLTALVNLMEKTPDKYICTDAIRDVLFYLRRSGALSIRESTALIGHLKGDSWWRDVKKRVKGRNHALKQTISGLRQLREILSLIESKSP